MMNIHCTFAVTLTAGLTAVAVPFAGQARLGKPIRTIVRLIAALPAWVSGGVFAYPSVPAGRATETNGLSPCLAAVAVYLKWLVTLGAHLGDGRQLPSAWTPAFRLTDLYPRLRRNDSAAHFGRAVFRRIARPVTEEAGMLLHCRWEKMKRFAAGDALSDFTLLGSRDVSPTISTSLRTKETWSACSRLKFKGSAAAVANGSRQFPLFVIHGYDYYSKAMV